MDNSSTLIGLSLFLLFIGTIIFLIYNLNLMEKLLHQKAKEYSMNLEETDVTATNLLGIDSKHQNLLIINRKNKESKFIFLQDIDSCDLNTVPREHLPGKYQIIKLVLFYKNMEVPPFEIIFYGEEDEVSSEAAEKLLLAKKWKKLINIQLSA